jgi:predicted RNase H-like HicB family nuclease
MAEALLADRGENFTYRDPDRDPKAHRLALEPLRAVPILSERVRKGIADADRLSHLPMQLIEKYANFAVRHAVLEQVEDGGWFATIPGFRGVWAKGSTEQETLALLREIVEDWTVLKVREQDRDLPEVEEINLNVL